MGGNVRDECHPACMNRPKSERDAVGVAARLHYLLAASRDGVAKALEQSLCRLVLAPYTELFREEVYDLGLARTDGRCKRTQVRHN